MTICKFEEDKFNFVQKDITNLVLPNKKGSDLGIDHTRVLIMSFMK